jgi:hypothetical protein
MNNLSDVNEPYFIDVYRNGVFNTTINGQGNATYTVFDEYVTTQSKTYEFSVRSASTITFDSELYFSYDHNIWHLNCKNLYTFLQVLNMLIQQFQIV